MDRAASTTTASTPELAKLERLTSRPELRQLERHSLGTELEQLDRTLLSKELGKLSLLSGPQLSTARVQGGVLSTLSLPSLPSLTELVHGILSWLKLACSFPEKEASALTSSDQES